MQTGFHIQGTPKQLVENGLTVNGKPVTQQMISVLVKLGAAEDLGHEERPEGSKGMPAKIYRFYGKKAFSFAVDKKKAEALRKASEQEKTAANAPAIPEVLQNFTPEQLQAMAQALQVMAKQTVKS